MFSYDKSNDRKPHINEFYREINGLKLPVYIFNPQIKNDKNDYVIISIHGGAWRTGIKPGSDWNGGDMLHQAKIFSQLGYIGAVISYRAIDNENVDISDLIDDCKEAIRFIKKRLNVDNRHIILMGDSAGAHLATCLGISDEDSIRPEIVISCNPVLDCTKEFSYASKSREVREKASPIFAKIEKCSKFLFIHGDKDPTTPIENTVLMHSRLKQMNFKTKMITLKDVLHAFILYNYISTDEEVEKYMEMILEYLDNELE